MSDEDAAYIDQARHIASLLGEYEKYSAYASIWTDDIRAEAALRELVRTMQAYELS